MERSRSDTLKCTCPILVPAGMAPSAMLAVSLLARRTPIRI
jgi:hypothetical protein